MWLKAKSKPQRVLEALQKAHPYGVGNDRLNDIMFRYGHVIYRLRRDGHLIRTERVRSGYYKYYWEGRTSESDI